MNDRYYSDNITKYNVINGLVESHICGYDWVAWKDYSHHIDSGYVNIIQSYIGVADSLANILRDEICSEKRSHDVYAFLFVVRQSLEMLLKRLFVHICKKSEKDAIQQSHDILGILTSLKDTIDWDNYNLSFANCHRAVDFLSDKDQLVKYPVDKKQNGHDNYMICIADWLELIHELYVIYSDVLLAEVNKKIQ